jgi:formamidopyrimidine-DNA glycosylase
MPELPEVEIVRRQLLPLLVGARFERVQTSRPSYFFLTPPAKLSRALLGRRCISLERHGKYLIATLDDESRLLLHLGMTGQILAVGRKPRRLLPSVARKSLATSPTALLGDPHVHLVLELSGRDEKVVFRDVRKFGKCQWLAKGQGHARLDKLGVDALGITGAHLYAMTRRRKAPIKSLLLDQGVLAGVGNIYADEALFLARIRPTRPGHKLKLAEAEKLALAVRAVLRKSLRLGGSSIRDYLHPDGENGGFQTQFSVYGQTGEPCSLCATPIQRRLIGQRSSHFCAECQR